MPEQVIIRPVEPHEHRLLSAIAFRSKAYWGYSTQFMETVREELSVSEDDINREHASYWLAESGKAVIGFTAVVQKSNDECRLDSLFIEPAYIGTGMGRLLIEFAKSYARNIGAQSLTLQSDPNAMPFYLAVGGVKIGETESDSIPGRYLPEINIRLDE